MELLKNEKGNTTLFMISLFGIFLLMFLLILSFANIFIEKEHASNNAEQASIVASGILLDKLEAAIVEYDSWLVLQLAKVPIPTTIEDLKPLGEQVEEEKGRLPFTLTDTEKKHQAINQVIKEELNSGNIFLPAFLNSELGHAEAEIRHAVSGNIAENNGEVTETTIVLNENNRIEVETATKYKAFKYDEYFSDSQRLIKQTGQGPTFDFADAMGWSLDINL